MNVYKNILKGKVSDKTFHFRRKIFIKMAALLLLNITLKKLLLFKR